MFTHLLCPIDGSAPSVEALDMAAKLAKEQGARLTICTVIDPAKAASMAFGDPPMTAQCLNALDEEGHVLVKDAAARVRDTITADVLTIDGQSVESIVEFAGKLGCDLIVMGSHGRTGFRRVFIGSVAEGVVCHATIPVLIVRSSALAVNASAATATASTASTPS
jgi:nucleotide-binding universal stress UspA family protein